MTRQYLSKHDWHDNYGDYVQGDGCDNGATCDASISLKSRSCEWLAEHGYTHYCQMCANVFQGLEAARAAHCCEDKMLGVI